MAGIEALPVNAKADPERAKVDPLEPEPLVSAPAAPEPAELAAAVLAAVVSLDCGNQSAQSKSLGGLPDAGAVACALAATRPSK